MNDAVFRLAEEHLFFLLYCLLRGGLETLRQYSPPFYESKRYAFQVPLNFHTVRV